MNSNLSAVQSNAYEQLTNWKVGALFMEPGTGKTRVSVNIVNSTDCDACIWIAPCRTIDNARQEIEKWGGLKMPVHYFGVEGISQSDRIYSELLDVAKKAARLFVVMDESLKIKNLQAKRTKRVLYVGRLAQYKLILNGTPLSKNLLDLYPQMQFLSPLILDMTPQRFKDTFCVYKTIIDGRQRKEFITGYANVDYLYSLISPYVFRAELRLGVDDRWHDVMYYIGDKYKDAYHEIKMKFLQLETLMAWNNNIFLAMIQSLQQSYCCEPNKVKALRKILEQCQGKHVIVFCKFIASRDLVSRTFPDLKVLSYQREALGLNLQKYNVIIFFDKTFDYSLRLQASRRIYRLGQTDDCEFYDLTGDIGLERMIDRNIARKTSMLEYFKSKTKEEIMDEL